LLLTERELPEKDEHATADDGPGDVRGLPAGIVVRDRKHGLPSLAWRSACRSSH
jgi:hypothetical protein